MQCMIVGNIEKKTSHGYVPLLCHLNIPVRRKAELMISTETLLSKLSNDLAMTLDFLHLYG